MCGIYVSREIKVHKTYFSLSWRRAFIVRPDGLFSLRLEGKVIVWGKDDVLVSFKYFKNFNTLVERQCFNARTKFALFISSWKSTGKWRNQRVSAVPVCVRPPLTYRSISQKLGLDLMQLDRKAPSCLITRPLTLPRLLISYRYFSPLLNWRRFDALNVDRLQLQGVNNTEEERGALHYITCQSGYFLHWLGEETFWLVLLKRN